MVFNVWCEYMIWFRSRLCAMVIGMFGQKLLSKNMCDICVVHMITASLVCKHAFQIHVKWLDAKKKGPHYLSWNYLVRLLDVIKVIGIRGNCRLLV